MTSSVSPIAFFLVLSAGACDGRAELDNGAVDPSGLADAVPTTTVRESLPDAAAASLDARPRPEPPPPIGRLPECVGHLEASYPEPGAPLKFYLLAEFASRNPWAGQDSRDLGGRAILYEEVFAGRPGEDGAPALDDQVRRIRIRDHADASHDETYLDVDEPLGPWVRDLRNALLVATSEPIQNSGRPVLAFDEIRRRERKDRSSTFDVRISIDQGVIGNNIHGQGATMQLSGAVTTMGDLLVHARLVRTLVLGPEQPHFAGQSYNSSRRAVRMSDVVNVSRSCTL